MTQGIETLGGDTTYETFGDALGVIDGALGKMMKRDLVSSGEVTDILLDVRTLLTAAQDD